MRGVLVFPSTMVPRPERLLLDRAEPVAIRDLEGVRLIHLVDSDTLVQRLNVRPGTRRTDFARTTGPETGFRSLRLPRPIREPGSSPAGVSGPPASEAALAADPDGPAAYNQGVGLLAAGKLDEARQQFEDAISEDDGYAPAFVGLGRTYLRQDAWDDAKYYLKRALKRAPESPPALMALSDVAMAEENWGDQKKWSARSLKQDPDNPEALYRLAVAHREAGKYQATVMRWLSWRRSERFFRRLVDEAPQYRDALYQFAVLKRYDKAFVKAIKLGENQVRIKPNELVHRRRLRRLYLYLLDNMDPEDPPEMDAQAWFGIRALFRGRGPASRRADGPRRHGVACLGGVASFVERHTGLSLAGAHRLRPR